MSESQSWLTHRVVLGTVFASLTLMPVALWMGLIGGSPGGLAFTTILFINLMLRGSQPLTKQEIYLLSIAISTAVYSIFFMQFVQRVYFSEAPEAKIFGITELLPGWWVPENPLIRKQVVRTFLHPDWLLPVSVALITTALGALIQVSLGYLAYQLFVVEERLPFPLARVSAEIAVTLGEREPRKVRIMSVGFVLAFIYSLLAYAPYIIGSTVQGQIVSIIPVPFADFSQAAETYLRLPGTLLGLSTDMFSFFSGFVLPTHVVLHIFVGSVAVWIVGNAVILSFYRWLVPEWTPGLNLQTNWHLTYLHVWSAGLLGLTFAAIVAQLAGGWRSIVLTFKPLFGTQSASGSSQPIKVSLLAYVIGVAGWLALLSRLVPHLPALVSVILVAIWPLLSTLINARAVGESGYSIAQIPMRELMLIYALRDVPVHSELNVSSWLAPFPGDGVSWCSEFYVARYVGVRIRDVLLATFALATPLSLIMSFIYTSLIWSFSPIPSQAFPWAQASWPISVIQSCIWIARGTTLQSALFNPGSPPLLEATFAIGLAVFLASILLRLPLSPVLLAVGASTIPPYALTLIIGHVAYKLLLRVTKGELEQLRWPLYAGAVVGYGVTTSILIAIAIVSKTAWLPPY
ncbi:MAG: hypothetical protein QW381_03980 [Thermofilaceae archaeon]